VRLCAMIVWLKCQFDQGRCPRKPEGSEMSPTALFLNILWLFFGGLAAPIAWGIAGVVMVLTIIGVPWARAAFNIAVYTLLRSA
jgi:hypothetical protein